MVGNGMTPSEIAHNELDYYRSISEEEWPEFNQTLDWWNSRICKGEDSLFIPSCQGFIGLHTIQWWTGM